MENTEAPVTVMIYFSAWPAQLQVAATYHGIRRAQFVVGPHFFSTLGKNLNLQTFCKKHARGSALAVEPTTH